MIQRTCLAVAVLSMLTGCNSMPRMATRVEIQAVDRSNESIDLTQFALALNRIVKGELLDPRALVDSRPLIDAYLAQAATHGPRSTPGEFATDDAKLAYYLNSHTAALLRSLMQRSTSKTVPERVPAGFERMFAFQFDGTWQTPADLAAAARRAGNDDWRVTLALSTVTADGPAIADKPYLPDLLDAQLDKAVRDALASPRVARIDHGEIKQILYWHELWSMRRALIADYERRTRTTDARLFNILLDWADSGFRRITVNSAVGYAETVMPRDSRVPWSGVLPAATSIDSSSSDAASP